MLFDRHGHGVNRIQKRVDNRMTNRKLKPVPGEEEGYKAFWEVAKDLDGLVDVVWVSGSRMLPALVLETSFANIKICSQSPNSLPTELRRPHRRLPPSLRVLNAFFIVRGARRAGIGSRAVREVLLSHPGSWEVPFQDDNETAVRFWRRTARAMAGENWTEERRAVPARPDLPPDVWISFATEAATS